MFDALCDWGCPEGRCSWDPMTALLAVIGDEAAAGYDTVIGTASADPTDGSNRFSASLTGKHKYVIKIKSDSYYHDMINEIIS